MNVNSIGEYIREQREQAKISLRQLAQTTGVSNPYLSQVERGLRRPSAEILQQIAKGLRISAEALYVQAGILDDKPADSGVRSALLADPDLSERQKQVLIEIYESFRRENGEAGSTDADHARGAERTGATTSADHPGAATDAGGPGAAGTPEPDHSSHGRADRQHEAHVATDPRRPRHTDGAGARTAGGEADHDAPSARPTAATAKDGGRSGWSRRARGEAAAAWAAVTDDITAAKQDHGAGASDAAHNGAAGGDDGAADRTDGRDGAPREDGSASQPGTGWPTDDPRS